MLRYAFLATIGLLATTAPLPAQPAKDASPPTPPPAESPNSPDPDPMEDTQLGDHWTYELRDEITGEVKGTYTNIVTDLTGSEISTRVGALGNSNTGYVTFDRSWNVKNNALWKYNPNDGTGIRLPLAAGKTWSFQATDVNSTNGFSSKRSGNSKVVGQESMTTRAGTFDTFKIETTYSLRSTNDPTKKAQVVVQTWYAPLINHWVKRASVYRADGRVRDNSTMELVEYGRR
jgi:hypothetical protein